MGWVWNRVALGVSARACAGGGPLPAVHGPGRQMSRYLLFCLGAAGAATWTPLGLVWGPSPTSGDRGGATPDLGVGRVGTSPPSEVGAVEGHAREDATHWWATWGRWATWRPPGLAWGSTPAPGGREGATPELGGGRVGTSPPSDASAAKSPAREGPTHLSAWHRWMWGSTETTTTSDLGGVGTRARTLRPEAPESLDSSGAGLAGFDGPSVG